MWASATTGPHFLFGQFVGSLEQTPSKISGLMI